MRIDGKVFLSVLAAGTVALAVAAVWLWPRLAGAGAKALAGRIGLLLATQLSVAATLLFAVNAWGGFYTSWGQLFGTASSKYTVTNRGAADPEGYDAKALVITSPVAASAAGTAPRGAHLSGLCSGLSADLVIYQPTGYVKPAAARRGFPVEVVDLTGGATGVGTTGVGTTGVSTTGVGTTGLGTAGLSATAYQQIANAYRVLVVVVSAPAAIPGVNVPEGSQGELFWAQDLPQALGAHYRIAAYPGAWAVAGPGPDGTAAVNLAIQDPAHYGLAAATGDWTAAADSAQSWPGIDAYLGSTPAPNVSILYDASAANVPAKLAASSGALQVAKQPNLTLTAALDWLGKSIDANVGAA